MTLAYWRALTCVSLVISLADLTPAAAGDEITSLVVHPDCLTLRGAADQRQLIVTAARCDGRLTDVTADAECRSENETVARVAPGGRVVPAGDGSTVITARYGGHSVTVPVEVRSTAEPRPINFANQIVPVFTKLGCNAGGCHGKASGQNGFRLSLLGFDPDADYAAIVQESRGRRVFPAAPDQSLLLRKATGATAHGGGRKLDSSSDECGLIRRWIAAGMPCGQPGDPVVTHVSVFPERRVLGRQARQQLAVYAHYSDGSVEDVTRRAQYESNDAEIAAVDASGLVQTRVLSGQATVMARYQGYVATFRAVVPLGAPVPAYEFPAQSVVDGSVQRQWQALGLAPSALCTDEEFVRRLSLDLTGTLPTPARVMAFATDTDPTKRARLVDELLETPEYAYFFANQWADVLRVKRRNDPARAPGTFAFHHWLCEAVASDKPYDELVRDLLTAAGDEVRNPPTVWYKEVQTPEQFADDVAQVFLGLRLSCAQCHHHPYEQWGQDDYWGLAAFFGRVGRKSLTVADAPQPQRPTQYVFTKPAGGVVNKRTGRPAALKPLGADPVEVGPDEDPRQRLADWVVDPANPYFARAVANRHWAHFFGRGIVDPVDDLRITNPPSNPELLDALAKDLTDHRYSLKALVRTICTSRTYQLSAAPNALNRHDKQNFARFYPRRMGAEVLLDAVCQVTASPSAFGGLPHDRHAPLRSIMLPDESFTSYFLDVFGRPQRASACACERGGEASLGQALHLLNSEEVHAKLARGGRADALARDPRPDAAKIEELFLWTYARRPTPTDLATALDHLTKHADDKKRAYENLLWALLNTKEFIFNH